MSGVRAGSSGRQILVVRLMPPGLPIGVSGCCFRARVASRIVIAVIALQYFVDVFIAAHYQEFR
jgi:hypothetical protein